MKTYLLALMMMVTGGCNVIVTDYTSPNRPAGSKEHDFSEHPARTKLKAGTTALQSEVEAVENLASEWREIDLEDHTERDAVLDSWNRRAATYRTMIASYQEDAEAADSLQLRRVTQIDSITAVVTNIRGQLQETVRRDEMRNIEAKLAPAGSFRFQGGHYSAIKVDPKQLDIHLHWKNASGEKYTSIQNLKSDLDKHGEKVLMITNAGMYNPDNSPQGLFIEDGKQLVPLDTTKGPSGQMLNFYLMPNGVFYIDNDGPKVVTTEKFPANTKGVKFATQSGPMLVIDGSLHPRFTKGSPNTNIRSGVGITANGEVIFAISDKPVNFYDFASLFRDALGCPNALYLDGAISKMYLPSSKRMDLGGDFGPIVSVTAHH